MKRFKITYLDYESAGEQFYTCDARDSDHARDLWAEDCPGNEIVEVEDMTTPEVDELRPAVIAAALAQWEDSENDAGIYPDSPIEYLDGGCRVTASLWVYFDYEENDS